MSDLLGVSESVPVTIGPITTYLHFLIRPSNPDEPDEPSLLGVPFLRQVQANIENRSNGQVVMTLHQDGIQFEVEVAPADQPGTCTDAHSSGNKINGEV